MKKSDAAKISLVGVGHVGSLVGFLLAMRGVAGEIVLYAREGADQNARENERKSLLRARPY